MRFAIDIPRIEPNERYDANAALRLIGKPTALTLPDGTRTLAVVAFAEVIDDGSALAVTFDYDTPAEASRRDRSQITVPPTSGNTDCDRSQSQQQSQPASQPMSQQEGT